LSTKELKAASAALAVAMEVAKERLGKGEYVDPSMLLRDLTTEQLDEFIQICRELERSFDRLIPPPEVEKGGEHHRRPDSPALDETRDQGNEGGYHGEE
jgi:hypothetical protein